MKDREILPLLLQQNRPTFFTLDDDFSKRELCHQNYSLVFMDIKKTRSGNICTSAASASDV